MRTKDMDVDAGTRMGEVFLLPTRRAVRGEALDRMRESELTLGYIEEAVGHLTSLSPIIAMSAGDWNVYSTRAQFAVGRVLNAIEKAEPRISDAGACVLPAREWAEILAKVRKEGMMVAALASALCSNSMPPADRCHAQSAMSGEVAELIAGLLRARRLFQRSA